MSPLTNNVEVKNEPTIVCMRKSQHETQNVKTHNRRTQNTKKMSNTDLSYSDVIYPDLDVNVLMMLAKWYITRFL
jgi:hypothetical protein